MRCVTFESKDIALVIRVYPNKIVCKITCIPLFNPLAKFQINQILVPNKAASLTILTFSINQISLITFKRGVDGQTSCLHKMNSSTRKFLIQLSVIKKMIK